MSDLQELERRIAAALASIGQVIEAGSLGTGTGPDAGAISDLEAALSAERESSAQLGERLRALQEQDDKTTAELQDKVDRLTRQLDAQGTELRRMRNNVTELRELVRALREAQTEGVTEPHLLNKAMLSELEALRITRLSEMVEMDEILAELKPLIGDMQDA